MNHQEIIQAFGFQIHANQPLESIYAYAPVYCLEDSRGKWIVKRTQKPLAIGQAVANWEEALASQGIKLITPAKGFGENPRLFSISEDLEEMWVVYPFVSGNPYASTPVQIEAAGRLLGQIHAAGAEKDFGLKHSLSVVAVDQEDVEADTETVLQMVQHYTPDQIVEVKAALKKISDQYFNISLPQSKDLELPLAACCWDYKASNLIYQTDDSPILIDADNAAYIPRLYDLAIALILFHNEGYGTGRIFTTEKWSGFLKGYNHHIQFTSLEKEVWNDLLLCAWVDEGLWLLANHPTGWADPLQRPFLFSLLKTDLSIFKIV